MLHELVIEWDAEACAQHAAMGFTAGWGVVADQLAVLAEAEARSSP